MLEGLEARVLLSGGPTDYLVDLTTDAGTGSNGTGDLLYCINQANANSNPAGSVIEFDPTVFNPAQPRSIVLSSTLHLSETAGPEVIVGPGPSVLTISGNDAVQVFDETGDAMANLSGLTIRGGQTDQGGGGIVNDGSLTVTSCTITGNTTDAAGGGIENDGTLTITDSTIADNSADFGGGIENEGALTVTGSTIESNTANLGGGLDNDEGGTASLTGTIVSSNSASTWGGGIFCAGASPVTLAGSTVSSNTAMSGGGLYSEGDGGDGGNGVSLASSTFSDNSATATSASSGGGGLFNVGGHVAITGCTFSGNMSANGGGGIFASQGALTITDSTVADNAAVRVGAGIDANSGTLTAVNCTIADNNEPSTGAGFGGGINIDQGTATLDNTIIALNTDGTGTGASPDNLYIDGSGTVSSASANNLIGAGGGNSGLTNGGNGNLVGVADPGLGTLASNGGPTQTIALLSGSPAIQAGSRALAADANLTNDQRGTGFPRVVNGSVDMGAFEVQVVTTNPAPALRAISPDEIAVGHADPLTLSVVGSGFIGESVVEWDSTALATVFGTGNTLTATIPASDFATAGSFSVTVVNPGPGGGTSNAETFRVLAVPTSVYVDGSYASDAAGTVVTWTDGSKHTVGFDAFGTVQA